MSRDAALLLDMLLAGRDAMEFERLPDDGMTTDEVMLLLRGEPD